MKNDNFTPNGFFELFEISLFDNFKNKILNNKNII